MKTSTLALDGAWLALLLGTAATWWMGESGQAGAKTVMAILVIAFFKGGLVAREFMALRGVKLWWQAVVIGWLTLVLVVNMAAYWKG